MTKLRLLLMVSAFVAFGCGGSGEYTDDEGTDLVDTGADKADGVLRPLGTYRQTGHWYEYSVVVLKSDKTYYLLYEDMDGRPIHDEGTYEWSKNGSTRYIRFLYSDGSLNVRYAYYLSGNVLTLREAGSDDKQKLTLSSDAWCGVPADCALQGLTSSGSWTCTSEVCGASDLVPTECPDVLKEAFKLCLEIVASDLHLTGDEAFDYCIEDEQGDLFTDACDVQETKGQWCEIGFDPWDAVCRAAMLDAESATCPTELEDALQLCVKNAVAEKGLTDNEAFDLCIADEEGDLYTDTCDLDETPPEWCEAAQKDGFSSWDAVCRPVVIGE